MPDLPRIIAQRKQTLQERPCLFPRRQNNVAPDVKPLVDQIVANRLKDSTGAANIETYSLTRQRFNIFLY
jgi:hypothetical protein